MQLSYHCTVLNIKHKAMTKLNPAQLELLKMFDQKFTDQDIENLRKVLARFLADKLSAEVTRIWDEKGYTDEHFANLHERTPYLT
jgi:hypothetical protein